MASKGKADGESRPTENSYDELEAAAQVAKGFSRGDYSDAQRK